MDAENDRCANSENHISSQGGPNKRIIHRAFLFSKKCLALMMIFKLLTLKSQQPLIHLIPTRPAPSIQNDRYIYIGWPIDLLVSYLLTYSQAERTSQAEQTCLFMGQTSLFC